MYMHPPSLNFSVQNNMSSKVVLQCTLLMFLIVIAASDVDKDKERCASDLVGLATCLPYVSGESKAPPIDCCTGLKQVLHNSPQCVCLLVKDRNDPTLGLKINATLALALPAHCHAPANVTNCPALLHLAPNSPDAKVFEDFANIGLKSNASAPAASATATATATANSSGGKTTAAAANEKSNGGMKTGWFGLEMVSGLLLTILALPNL